MPKDDHGPRPPAEEPPFPYMRWAKAHLGWEVPLNLGMSGARPPAAEMSADWGLPAPPGEVGDPEADLKALLAARYGMEPPNVHVAAGTSHANFLVYLAFARGGRVAAETPGYQALHGLGPTLGAEVALFRRDPARRWRIDPEDLRRALVPAPSLIAVTDLHNPSGARLHEEDLDLLVEAAEACDALVLVDEVYADFDPLERPSAARRHPRVLATNSLTKCHGLGDLRAGWILGAAEHVRTLEALDDLVHPVQPAHSMTAAATYLPFAAARMAGLRAQAAALARRVDAWLQAAPDLWWTLPDGGLTGFVRVGADDGSGRGDRLAARLWERHAVRAVPGSFFQRSGWVRISFELDAPELDKALAALDDVLSEVS